MAARLSPVEFAGPAGKLEGMLHHDPALTPAHVAVFCHQHPLYGGTMHNKVVFRASEALAEMGLPVLRFNFRGVNHSEGEHDAGRGEQEDVRAAMHFITSRFGPLPVLLGGTSFGAAMALQVGCIDRGVTAMLVVAPPISGYEYPGLASCARPKAVIQGTADTVCPEERLLGEWPRWAGPKRLFEVSGGSHFFDRQLPELKAAVRQGAEWALAAVDS